MASLGTKRAVPGHAAHLPLGSTSVPAATDIEPSLMLALGTMYDVREPDAIEAFIDRHPEVADVLREEAWRIPESLPTDERVALELVQDPDVEDDDGELFAIVRTRMGPEEVRPFLTQMQEGWLIDAARRAGGRFNVDIEFV